VLLTVHAVVSHPITVNPIKVAFERVHVSGPEPAELGQPGIQLLKRSWLQSIDTALRVHSGFDETSFAQNAQVF
jgi:hypothetical protein